jgi:Spy/CpxP family protein refolding chaperone
MTVKAKLISGLAAIFVAGLVVGGSVGFQVARSSAPKAPPTERRDAKAGNRGGDFVERMCSRQQRDLGLSDEQLAKIKPIYEQASAELKAVNAENYERVRAIFRASHEKIKPFLTTNQVQKLEEKNREREMRFKKHSQEKPPKC